MNRKDSGVLFHADQEDQRLAGKNIAARLANRTLQQPVSNNPDIYNLGIFY